ncbi:MAG: hypothetical protein JNM56_39230 [Planctomycetia bacterium]|nr:hypothetical protein [Planctomycetia bacterium]
MHRCLSLAVLVGLFGLLPFGNAQVPKAVPGKPAAKEPVFGKDFVNAKLVAVEDGRITVEFTYTAQVIVPEIAQKIENLNQAFKDANNIQNQAQRFAVQQQILLAGRDFQKQLYKAEEKTEQQPFELDEKTKVRIASLPTTDAEGKPIKYTPAQLKELKGTGNLPGYTAKPDDLKVGQLVRVYFLKGRPDQQNPFASADDKLVFNAVTILIKDSPPEE